MFLTESGELNFTVKRAAMPRSDTGDDVRPPFWESAVEDSSRLDGGTSLSRRF